MRQLAQQLTAERSVTALALARLPQSVRGFGHVKEHSADAARTRQRQLLKELASRHPPEPQPESAAA